MEETFELKAEFEIYRRGGETQLAKLPFSSGPPDHDIEGYISLEATLLPERGPGYVRNLKLTIADQPLEVGRTIGLDSSVCEFSGHYKSSTNSETIVL